MPRAPFNVLVFLYRENGPGLFEYAIFRRADLHFWQPIAGGGEQGETPIQAAQREALEEAGFDPGDAIFLLQTVNSVSVDHFSDSWLWGEEVYVIPQYCFAASAGAGEIRLSHEHTEYCWMTYEEAEGLLKYDGNRIALWELNQRLRGKGPRG